MVVRIVAVDEPPAATDLPADPDRKLVREALADRARFVGLYDRYFASVQAYVRVRVPERSLADDVTSQVFLSALANLGEFRRRGSFAAWLFRIAGNAVRDAQRLPRTVPLAGEYAHARIDSAHGPEEEALRQERLRLLRRSVTELAGDEQDLLALRYGAGLRSGEIAELLGTTPGAVRMRLHRILEQLRRRYSDED